MPILQATLMTEPEKLTIFERPNLITVIMTVIKQKNQNGKTLRT